jgi:hypothetical protein
MVTPKHILPQTGFDPNFGLGDDRGNTILFFL